LLRSATVTAIDCIQYALSLPTPVVTAGIESLDRLDQAFAALRQPLTETERTALLARTERAASRGEFEPFKTTSIFDATALNPAWLGEERERVQQVVQD